MVNKKVISEIKNIFKLERCLIQLIIKNNDLLIDFYTQYKTKNDKSYKKKYLFNLFL